MTQLNRSLMNDLYMSNVIIKIKGQTKVKLSEVRFLDLVVIALFFS